jgi:glycosyltransferase involved in cell wall biosynthesis
MHILYLITRAEMGGSQTHLADLLNGFRHEFQLTLATGEEGYLTEEARNLGIPVYVLSRLVQPLSLIDDACALRDIVRLLRRLRPDVLHCHTSKAGILGRAAARTVRTPAVFTAHTWCFAEGTSTLWKVVGTPSERFAARWTEKIIAVSDSNYKLAIKQRVAQPDKIVTVHNGIADTIHRARPDRAGIPRIVMVARFVPQKNQLQLIEALANMEFPFRLTFVGDGPNRPAAEDRARQLNFASRVEFLGTRTDTDRILSDSDVFVLSTHWEGFPITILEAMRSGLPVVATDVDGVREAVLDGETGYLVQRGDTPELTAKLRLLLSSPDLRAQLGSAGRRRYESEFTRAVMLAKVSAIYEGIVSGAGRSEAVLQSA